MKLVLITTYQLSSDIETIYLHSRPEHLYIRVHQVFESF